MEDIYKIKEGRLDLSHYLIHFTRDNKDDNVGAFSILKQIIKQGYLKAGWSFRGTKRTVCGIKPAVCFTEAPLYGFLNYIEKRPNDKITQYGLFLKKEDVFSVGGKPVIYGTTLYSNQICTTSEVIVEGFPMSEQYRYILTAINDKNDWTHEREWRWANWNNYSDKDDIFPIWSSDSSYIPAKLGCWTIGIIVKTEKEAKDIIEILVEKTNAIKNCTKHTDDYYLKFNAVALTRILVLERYSKEEQQLLQIDAEISDLEKDENRLIHIGKYLKSIGFQY